MDYSLINLLIFNEKIKEANAIILLEGDGYSRISTACKLVVEKIAPVLVFSGGIENLVYGSYPYEMCKDLIKEEGIENDQIIVDDKSMNTREQAENILALAERESWDSIILVASHYHQLRAFLTFLKVLKERGLFYKVNIQNYPVKELKWFEKLDWGNRFDLLKDEFFRIEKYYSLGHICEFNDVIEYYKWKELI